MQTAQLSNCHESGFILLKTPRKGWAWVSSWCSSAGVWQHPGWESAEGWAHPFKCWAPFLLFALHVAVSVLQVRAPNSPYVNGNTYLDLKSWNQAIGLHLRFDIGKTPLEEQSGTKAGCPWRHHPHRCPRSVTDAGSGDVVNGQLISGGQMAGLDDLGVFSNINNSVTMILMGFNRKSRKWGKERRKRRMFHL